MVRSEEYSTFDVSGRGFRCWTSDKPVLEVCNTRWFICWACLIMFYTVEQDCQLVPIVAAIDSTQAK